MKVERARIQNGDVFAGTLIRDAGGFRFEYDAGYRSSPATYPISVTFPKSKPTFHSEKLFPFFFGLLSEGEDMKTQCRVLRIGEKDAFARLLKTAHTNTIGSITVHEERNA